MRLGRRRRQWPTFDLPPTRGEITIQDVVAVAPGPERDRAIDDWCASVWQAWSGSKERVIVLLGEMGEAR